MQKIINNNFVKLKNKAWVLFGLLSCLALFNLVNAQNTDIPEHVLSNIKKRCAVCHGENGESSSPLFPKLAASNYVYFAKQMNDFASGARDTRTMSKQIRKIDPQDFEAYGRYYERLTPDIDNKVTASEKGKQVFITGRPAEGVISCISCHGKNGYGSQYLPRLAGQIPEYTINQLNLFSERQRTNDNSIMQGIAAKLTEEEINEVANYIATLK